MKTWALRIGTALGLIVLGLMVYNSSLWAPEPKGRVKMIAHRGIYHLYDHSGGIGRDECTATRIYPPKHELFENSIAGIRGAFDAKAHMVEVDVAPTKDGKMVLFHDWTLDCRTNGKGETRDATLAELQKLDIGYGYSADGGKTFPLRGKGIGLMPSVEQGLLARYGQPLMFNFKSKDAGEADMLADILIREKRDPVKLGDGFYGHEGPVNRIKARFPGVWAWSTQATKACTMDYIAWGWTGFVPDSCKDGTLVVPLNRQFAFWGWPNRTIARMASVGGRIIVVGPLDEEKPMGLTQPRQLGEIPSNFNGYIWVEDIQTVGPSLIQ